MKRIPKVKEKKPKYLWLYQTADVRTLPGPPHAPALGRAIGASMVFCLNLGLALLFWLQMVTPAVPNQLGPRSRVFHETHQEITPSEQTLCTLSVTTQEDSKREFSVWHWCWFSSCQTYSIRLLLYALLSCRSPFTDTSGFLQSDTWLSSVCPGRASLVLLTLECLKQMNTEPAQQL